MRDFTGRAAGIARIVDRLRSGRTPVVCVEGTAGIGKTALAVHCAHQVADGCFRFPHDLLREYAWNRAGDEEPALSRQDALNRLMGWYTQVGTVLDGRVGRVHVVGQDSRATKHAPISAADAEAELRNLTAAVEHIAEHGPYAAAWTFAGMPRETCKRRSRVLPSGSPSHRLGCGPRNGARIHARRPNSPSASSTPPSPPVSSMPLSSTSSAPSSSASSTTGRICWPPPVRSWGVPAGPPAHWTRHAAT
ncbi:ATP-binding protein [Streptomyces uncialis]